MGHLKVLNLKTAFYVCMYRVQYAVYHMVIANLKSSREVKKSNELHKLHNSSLSYGNQHQVILTPGHHLTEPILTPWCRVLLEKLTGLQLVKKLPAFHGTQRFITALTSIHHLSLSWASPIQSIYTHSTSWRSILILSTLLSLGPPVVSLP